MLKGARDVFPMLLGLMPLGLAVGATIAESTVNHAVGWVGAALIFTASAHIVAMGMLSAGAGGLAVIVAVLVINSRGLIYGAGLATRMHGQPRWFRWFAPYFLIDPVFALVSGRTQPGDGAARIRWYYLGVAGALWLMWMPTVGVGLVVGDSLPAEVRFDFALQGMLIGFLVPQLCGGRGRVAAAAGATAGVLTTWIPGGAGLPLSVAIGVAVALFVEWRRR